MKYFKSNDGISLYRVIDTDEPSGFNESIVNYYIQDSHKSEANILLEVKILCDFFSYIGSLKIEFLKINMKVISDFIMYLRCPDGIKLNSINKAAVSEIKVREYLRTIIIFCKCVYFYSLHIFECNEETKKDLERIRDYFIYKDIMIDYYNFGQVHKKKTLRTIMRELNNLNSRLLSKVQLIEYDILSDEEIEEIEEAAENDIEYIIILFCTTFGVNISSIADNIENTVFIYKDKYVFRKSSKSGYIISEDIYELVADNYSEIHLITKKQVNSVLKRISKDTKIKFTEKSLIDRFIINHYAKEKDIITISQLTDKNFNYIFKLIKKYFKRDVLNDLYSNFNKQFYEVFKREYTEAFDGGVSANKIQYNALDQVKLDKEQ